MIIFKTITVELMHRLLLILQRNCNHEDSPENCHECMRDHAPGGRINMFPAPPDLRVLAT